MRKKEIEGLIDEFTNIILSGTDIELIDVEYVKEGTHKYLRVYIDKEGGVTLQDCQEVSQKLSMKLDEVDPIEENYFLEVSSPGIDRPLKNNKDLERSIGKDIEISLYKPLDGKKKFVGLLKSYDEENIVINVDDEIVIPRKDIAKINLAIIF